MDPTIQIVGGIAVPPFFSVKANKQKQDIVLASAHKTNIILLAMVEMYQSFLPLLLTEGDRVRL